MTRYWAASAFVDGSVVSDTLISTAGGSIEGIEVVPRPPDDAVTLGGFVIPGLSNTHSHAFHRVLRGHGQDRGSFWSWREEMYRAAKRLDPDSYHRVARAVYGEMAMAGLTAVGEFHYLHHAPGGARYADPNAMGAALVAAAADAGIRITLLDALYLSGGFGDVLEGAQLRFGDGDVDSWASRVGAVTPAAHLRIGAAVHSIRAVPPHAVAVAADWAEARGAPFHFHLSEQPAENEGCRSAYGATPTEVFAEAGGIGPGATAVHAVHVSDHDVRLLGGSGTAVCICPTTERDLGDGIAPATRLRAAGCRLAVGTDSHAVIDPFVEMRLVELDERLRDQARTAIGPLELLAAGTIGGMRSLGWDDAGVLEVGRRADFVAVDPTSIRTAGIDDPVAAVAYAATAADVVDVVAGGRVIVRGGRHVRIDVERELVEAIEGVRDR